MRYLVIGPYGFPSGYRHFVSVVLIRVQRDRDPGRDRAGLSRVFRIPIPKYISRSRSRPISIPSRDPGSGCPSDLDANPDFINWLEVCEIKLKEEGRHERKKNFRPRRRKWKKFGILTSKILKICACGAAKMNKDVFTPLTKYWVIWCDIVGSREVEGSIGGFGV